MLDKLCCLEIITIIAFNFMQSYMYLYCIIRSLVNSGSVLSKVPLSWEGKWTLGGEKKIEDESRIFWG